MRVEIRPAAGIDWLVSALADADEDIARVRTIVGDRLSSSYEIVADGERIGALTMRWHPERSEIVYIALDAARRGTGLGKAALDRVAEEAHRRAVSSIIVGTANASLGTIAFYQKCGYRLDSVRRDYFDYFREPVYENGIQIRDMLVLRLDIPEKI